MHVAVGIMKRSTRSGFRPRTEATKVYSDRQVRLVRVLFLQVLYLISFTLLLIIVTSSKQDRGTEFPFMRPSTLGKSRFRPRNGSLRTGTLGTIDHLGHYCPNFGQP
jgi:hypothetical protein